MPVPGIFGNCISAVYEDGTFETHHWWDAAKIMSRKKYLAIRVFHNQSGNPAQLSNEVRFTGRNIVTVHYTLEGLLVRTICESPNKADERAFLFNGQQPPPRSLPLDSRHSSVGGSLAMLYHYEFTNPDYAQKVAAAEARQDLGPCPFENPPA